MTLGAQSVDSNSLLGNVDLSYKYHFFDGAAIPIGLGLSLILNAIFLARHINGETNVLTLPDVLAKRYGKVVEVMCSLVAITAFLMLLAGNLVGMVSGNGWVVVEYVSLSVILTRLLYVSTRFQGVITSYVWGFSQSAGIWVSAIIVWAYTVSGGLFSVAYTDVVQGVMGW